MHINYTSYDVRRDQDILNPGRNRANIMLLADPTQEDEDDTRLFRYARVLRIFHVNVITVGAGMADDRPRRVEVLWVRWYRRSASTEALQTGWKHRALDRVVLPPPSDYDSFDFVDPEDVIRACYVVPVFAKGKVHANAQGLSKLACDADDWTEYFVNR